MERHMSSSRFAPRLREGFLPFLVSTLVFTLPMAYLYFRWKPIWILSMLLVTLVGFWFPHSNKTVRAAVTLGFVAAVVLPPVIDFTLIQRIAVP